MKYPSAREIARRFVKYAGNRLDRYEEGIRNPDVDWEKATMEAEGNYEEGVKKGILRKAYGKGVKRCGTARQQAKSILKGLIRWPEGISGAEDDMTAAMGPVETVMKAITLPKKYPKGDPRNHDRSKIIGTTLRKAKEEGRI